MFIASFNATSLRSFFNSFYISFYSIYFHDRNPSFSGCMWFNPCIGIDDWLGLLTRIPAFNIFLLILFLDGLKIHLDILYMP